MIINLDTSSATVLLGLQWEDGVIRCLVDQTLVPGITFEMKPLLAFGVQLADALNKIGIPMHSVKEVFQQSLGHIEIDAKEFSSLVVATLSQSVEIKGSNLSWKTLPDILRSLDSSVQSRKPYLKAFQYFAGTHKENVKALDSSDLR